MLWWLTVVLVDAGVAVALLAGLAATSIVNKYTNPDMSTVTTGVAVGLLGPLALRSPVRKTKLKGQESAVGITYLYDVVRIYALYALDERIVRLLRRDVGDLRNSWISAGLTSQAIANELKVHLVEHERLPVEVKGRIRKEVASSLTLPDETSKIDALIKIMRRDRLRAVMDHFHTMTERTSLLPSPEFTAEAVDIRHENH